MLQQQRGLKFSSSHSHLQTCGACSAARASLLLFLYLPTSAWPDERKRQVTRSCPGEKGCWHVVPSTETACFRARAPSSWSADVRGMECLTFLGAALVSAQMLLPEALGLTQARQQPSHTRGGSKGMSPAAPKSCALACHAQQHGHAGNTPSTAPLPRQQGIFKCCFRQILDFQTRLPSYFLTQTSISAKATT